MRMWSNLALKLASLNALLSFLFVKRITNIHYYMNVEPII